MNKQELNEWYEQELRKVQQKLGCFRNGACFYHDGKCTHPGGIHTDNNGQCIHYKPKGSK